MSRDVGLGKSPRGLGGYGAVFDLCYEIPRWEAFGVWSVVEKVNKKPVTLFEIRN